MTARNHWEKDAGDWLGWEQHLYTRRSDGATYMMRSYPWRDDGVNPIQAWTTQPDDAMRYDTKADALAAVRRGRGRVQGVRTGAERFSERAER